MGFSPFGVFYHNLTMDVSITKNNIQLVEINNFGDESPCDASLFNWQHNREILYNSDELMTTNIFNYIFFNVLITFN
jgi:hypothetical protein